MQVATGKWQCSWW